MGKTVAAWFLMAAAASAPASTPRDTVQSGVARVIHTIEDARYSAAERRVADRLGGDDKVRVEIRRIATDLFDFEECARRALSRHWAGRTKAEQAEFVALFTDLLERSYVGKIEAYSGEKIVYTGELIDGEYATVRSRIITKRRTETGLDYRLRRVDGRWKVYDVLIDGVSFISTYRSEFNRIIQSSSWDDLMDRLRRKQIEIRTVVDHRPN